MTRVLSGGNLSDMVNPPPGFLNEQGSQGDP
jgi:hypothetical protein